MSFPMYYLRRQEIRSIIKDHELKIWWVAEFAGVHKTTLRRWLSGKIQTVRKENVERLARILSISECVISYPVKDLEMS